MNIFQEEIEAAGITAPLGRALIDLGISFPTEPVDSDRIMEYMSFENDTVATGKGGFSPVQDKIFDAGQTALQISADLGGLCSGDRLEKVADAGKSLGLQILKSKMEHAMYIFKTS